MKQDLIIFDNLKEFNHPTFYHITIFLPNDFRIKQFWALLINNFQSLFQDNFLSLHYYNYHITYYSGLLLNLLKYLYSFTHSFITNNLHSFTTMVRSWEDFSFSWSATVRVNLYSPGVMSPTAVANAVSLFRIFRVGVPL